MNTTGFKSVSLVRVFSWIIIFNLSLQGANARKIGPGEGNAAAKKQKPNIVLIVADDLGYGDLSVYGATKISTPTLDKLASEGMKFDNAYVTSSLCTPSRYSILTGRYPWRTRLKFGVLKYYEEPLIKQDETTLASLLKRNGYRTACVGKWHLGLDWKLNGNAPENPEQTVFNSWSEDSYKYIDFSQPIENGPTQRGFDYFYGMAGSNNMQPYVYIENDRVLQPPTIEQKPYDHYVNVPRASNWDIKRNNIDLTEKAVEVINKHFKTHKSDPLFLYFPASAPHRPCLPTFTKGKSEAGLRGDMVEELDWTVNEIILALKENGVYENTLLIFTSDNGPRPGDPALWINKYAEGNYEDYHQSYFGNYEPEYIDPNGNQIWKAGWYTYGHNASGDLLGFKSDAWEGGFKVPFIVHWPGKVKAGAQSHNTICTADLFATFAELVGDKPKSTEAVDSYSFLPNIFNSQANQSRKSLVLTAGASGAFVAIKDKWKYIEAATPGRWPETYYPNGPNKLEPQLYYLSKDWSEHQNLYNANPAKVAELKKIIESEKERAKND